MPIPPATGVIQPLTPPTKYDSKPAGTLLDRDREIASKQAYSPGPLEQQYNAAIYAEFNNALWQFQNTHQFFNDRTLVQYITRNQQDAVAYVPPRRDPLDWRNHRRSTLQYDKTAAILSFFIDLNFQCEPTAQDWLGRVNPKMAEVSEALLQHANILDDQVEKDKIADYAMLVDGTVFEEVSWAVRKQVKKIERGSKWNPKEDPSKTSFETRWVDTFEGVETKLMKINRVLLGDLTKLNIDDQPYFFKEYVIPYDVAYELFHDYFNWKYVASFDSNTDQWTDTDTDIEIEESQIQIQRLVRVRVYENIVRNEYAIYCNKVLMTPVGMPLPYGQYSLTMQQAGILNHHFAYGRSFVDHLRRDVATRDVLYSLFIDKARQGLEPPMKSSFKALINRHMFRPGAITPMQGGDLTPLIPENALQNFAKDAIMMLEQSIDRASVSPIFQGQDAPGSRTKYEVEQQLINSIRTAALIVSAAVNRRRQKAEKMFNIILQHYPDMSFGKLSSDADEIKRFVINGGEDTTQKEIMFQEPSDDDFDLTVRMMEETEQARMKGTPVKKYLVDPSAFQAYEYVFNFRVNPQQRDSKSTDILEVEKKYNMYMQNPLIDPTYPTKMMLRANGDSPDEALRKEPPQAAQPQMSGKPLVPGTPGPGEPIQPQGIAGTPALPMN